MEVDLPALVRRIVAEIDVDGAGFRTQKAADELLSRLTAKGLIAPDGTLMPEVSRLVRIGARKVVSEHDATARPSRKGGEFLEQFTALDETADAIRKKPIRLGRVVN